MRQSDWLGGGIAEPVFRDIRDARPSAAEEKAVLLLTLGGLINSVPACVHNGSVDRVRAWKQARDGAARVAKNARSSAHEIQAAINNMRRFES